MTVRPCGIEDGEHSDAKVELNVQIIFYKQREIISDNKPHMVALRCVPEMPEPITLKPLDSYHGMNAGNRESMIKKWAETRAAIAVALALADAQFLELFKTVAPPDPV